MSSHLIRAVIFEMRTFQAFFVNDEGCLTAVAAVVVEMAVVVMEAETTTVTVAAGSVTRVAVSVVAVVAGMVAGAGELAAAIITNTT